MSYFGDILRPINMTYKMSLELYFETQQNELFELGKQKQVKVQNLRRKCFAPGVLSFKLEIENTNILANV